MSIHTKRGDKGSTDLFSGERLKKSDIQVEAYGVIDEANSWLGLARVKNKYSDLDSLILSIQHKLFVVGAQLASLSKKPTEIIRQKDVGFLEEKIGEFEKEVSIKGFIIPGDSELGSLLNIVRTIIRRAERKIILTQEIKNIHFDTELLKYINRVSDLLFMMSRVADKRFIIKSVTHKVRSILQNEEK